jgi:NADH-quinone oxidoreductase subunit N
VDPRALGQVLDNVSSVKYLWPEIVLTLGVLGVIVWDLAAPKANRFPGVVAIALAALLGSATISISYLTRNLDPKSLFGGQLAFDSYANLFRALFGFITATVLVCAIPSAEAGHGGKDATKDQRGAAEFITLLLVVSIGMNLMAMGRSLLMIYLSIEIVSVISFVMAGFKVNDRKSSEAALKYVVFGGVSSGIMLYGMSWLFGLTRSLLLPEISERILALTKAEGHVPEVVFMATVCVMAGFGYKISAAPFHMWAPDVYEGAPTTVTAFFSVGPKAAGFAVLIRFFADALQAHGGSLGDIQTPWPIVGGVLSMATMFVGNLSALQQNNVKRMLAYSSIAHAGYMLLGFCVFTHEGITAVVFYLFTYCLMNLGAFLIVIAVAEQNGGDETVGAFTGLGLRAPVMAAAMSIFLFSLTGLPPFAGFVGKFYIFAALLRAGGKYADWNWFLAAMGVVNSVISLFYYARLLRAMYFTKAEIPDGVTVRRLYGTATFALVVPTVVLGLYWGPIYDFVAKSMVMVR